MNCCPTCKRVFRPKAGGPNPRRRRKDRARCLASLGVLQRRVDSCMNEMERLLKAMESGDPSRLKRIYRRHET